MTAQPRSQDIFTRPVQRRTLLKGLTATIGAASLAPLLDACGSSVSSSSNGPVTLRFSVLPQQAEADNAKAFVAAFNKKYPNIHVNVEQLSGGDYHQKLLLQAASNSLPDLFWIEDESVTTFAAKHTMLELDSYIQKSNFNTSDIYPSMLNLGKYQGHQYMLPRDYNHLVTFYNVDMFKAANVPLPQDGWTWSDMVSAAQKLTKKDAKGNTTQYGIDGGNFNWWAMAVPTMRGFGATIIDNGNVVVDASGNAPAAAQGINALYQLVKDGIATNFTTNTSAGFSTNQAAMAFTVRPVVQSYAAASKGRFTWNVATFPAFPVQPRVGTGASGYAISSQTQYKDEAWQLLSFIDSPEGQKVFEATGNSVPVLMSLKNDSTWLNSIPNLNNQAFIASPEADTLPLSIDLPPGTETPVVTDMGTLLGQVFTGRTSPEQMVSQWAQQIKQAISGASS